MHWNEYDAGQGQQEYRERLNVLLERYGPGYELNDRGEIMVLGARGLNTLLHRELPTKEQSVLERVQSAGDRFRRYGSTADDRRQAVRDLADVLEFLRPQIKTALLKKDESALFEIMNNFAIPTTMRIRRRTMTRRFGCLGCFTSFSHRSTRACT
jgi:hypothetical protein